MNKRQVTKVKLAATLLLTPFGIIGFFASFGCGFGGGEPLYLCIPAKFLFYLFLFPYLIISQNDFLDTPVGLVVSFIMLLTWSYLLVSIVYYLLTFLKKIKK